VSAPATVTIGSGNTAPSVGITSPAASALFTVGAAYTLRATATDAQDGTLPDSALSWTVLRRHDTHTHPYLGPVAGNGIALTGPAPEDLGATSNSWLEIHLTATDSAGLRTTVVQEFRPLKVGVTLATRPFGRTVTANGTTVTGPTTVTSWAGYQLRLAVPAQTDALGRAYGFDRWSDGGASSHTVTTPSAATTLTADLSLRGLQAAYYDALNFSGTPVSRLDATVGFDWGTGAPAGGLAADTFSVRWTGQVVPRYSETYTFSTTSDDGVRLWVDGRLLVDQWNDHAATVHSGTIALTAGTRYAVVMEYYENGGNAVAKLGWSSPSQPAQTVPADRLYPAYYLNFQPAGRPRPSGYVADTGATYARRAGLAYGWRTDNSALMRDREAANSPDQRYDTLALTQRPENPTATWELGLLSGTYRVRVVSGDPTAVDSVYRTNAETVLAVSGTPTTSARWVDGTVSVSVTDGRLTLSNASGSSNNKICFVQITLL